MSSRSETDARHPSANGGAGAARWIRAGWLALFGWWLAAYVLTLDRHGWLWTELATLKAGRLSFTGMLADRATFGHCPLYFTLSWVIQKAIGEHLVALRLPSAVFGLAVALLVHRIARRWANDSAALFTALTVLLSPLLLDVSQQARPYALALLFGLAATAVLVDPRAPAGHRRALLFGLISLAGLLTSHAYWFVLAAHLAALVPSTRRHAGLLLAGGAAVLAAMPWTIYAKFFAESGGESERFLDWMGPVEALTSLALPGRLAARLHFLPDVGAVVPITLSVVVVGLAVIGLVNLPRDTRNNRTISVRPIMAALWIVPPVAALAAGLLGWGNLLLVPRYFAATAVVQLMLIAWAVWKIAAPKRNVSVSLLVALLVAQSVFHLVEVGRDEVRRSAEVIEAEGAAGEAVIMIALRKDIRLLKYYLDSAIVSCFIIDDLRDDAEVSERFFPRYRGRKRGAWILVSRKSDATVATSHEGHFEIDAYLERVGRRYRKMETRPIGDYDLHHFRDRIRRGGAPPQTGESTEHGDKTGADSRAP